MPRFLSKKTLIIPEGFSSDLNRVLKASCFAPAMRAIAVTFHYEFHMKILIRILRAATQEVLIGI